MFRTKLQTHLEGKHLWKENRCKQSFSQPLPVPRDLTNIEKLKATFDLTDVAAGSSEGVTDGAAGPLGGADPLAVAQRVTLDLLADGHALLADAHPTRLRSPDVVLLERLSVHGAAVAVGRIYD